MALVHDVLVVLGAIAVSYWLSKVFGFLLIEDFRISPDTLRRQADTAREAGYPQLADNLLRAAELTRLSNEELLEIYGKLRPGRTTHAEMTAIADRLDKHFGAPLTAEFVREAARVYRRRALVKDTTDS